MAELHWRPLRVDDLSSVSEIAAAAFPHHYEAPACFAERLMLSPEWCFGLEDETGALLGYLIAYPWPLGSIPPVNTLIGTLPDKAETLFLHDLALHPAAAGTGQARAIVERLAREAESAGFNDIALVSVNDTARFWERLGFRAIETPAVEEKLASYGQGARYMREHLGRWSSTGLEQDLFK